MPEIAAVDDEFDEGEDTSSAADFPRLLSEISRRCKAANITLEINKTHENEEYCVINFPSGRHKRNFSTFHPVTAEKLLASNFEKYTFLDGYEAISSYKDDVIEASVSGPTFAFQRRVLKLNDEGMASPNSLEEDALSLNKDTGAVTLTIGQPTADFKAITRMAPTRRLTLKIKGAEADTNDKAIQVLKRYSDSLFFQIDALYDLLFTLERERRPIMRSRRARPDQEPGVEFPKREYDHSAMSLWWYARSARSMPLLQFLAFYQVMEFYFPRYAQMEARTRISSVLKDPTFRSDREAHIDKVISAITVNRSGNLGDERSQLRAVINHCLSADDLRNFIEAEDGIKAHFSGKASRQKYHKVPVENISADLRNDVADRIYDIRCKVVHTKNDARGDSIEMILPFSEDADYLGIDIILARFIAGRVLIAASVPLE